MRRVPLAGVELVRDIGALVDGADHIVLAAPATARTEHLIDAEVFAAVEPGVHLVNIAPRGTGGSGRTPGHARRRPGRRRDARHRRSRAAARGPLALLASAGAARTRMCRGTRRELQRTAVEIFVDNLGRFLRDEPLLHVVDRDEGY